MTKMTKVITLTIVVALLTSATIFLTASGGFAGYINKKPFNSVHTYFEGSKNMNVIFEDVEYAERDVWVDVEDVEVKIRYYKPNEVIIAGTLISVSPTVTDRLFGESVFYEASSVTVWVESYKEQEEWVNFINDTTYKRDVLKEKRPTKPNKVTP